MTRIDLEKYWYLVKEIDLLERQIKELKSSGRKQGNIPASSKSWPFGHDLSAEAQKEIEEKKEQIHALITRKQEIDSFVESINDYRLRQIFTLRYLEGCKWKEVALHFGHKESEDSVKKAAERFLKKSSIQAR